MKHHWTIGAQLSTSHSPREVISADRMLAVIDHVRAAIALDLLVVGAREAADVFRVMTGAGRPFDQVFLWYNLLSDIDGMEESDLVVSWRGERSRGWGGWAEKGAEVNETFRFVCPNNPAAREDAAAARRDARPISVHWRLPRQAALSLARQRLRRGGQLLLRRLPAGGASDRPRSRRRGAPVRRSRHRHRHARSRAAWRPQRIVLAASPCRHQSPARPLSALPGRQHHKTRRQAAATAAGLGRKVALDLFSPGLAQLAGQDYRAPRAIAAGRNR